MSTSGDNAFVLISSAMICFMVPGFAFFYGGTADRKNVLTAIVYCLLIFCVAIITQSLISYSLAFGNPTVANGFIGDCYYCGLTHIQTSLIENASLPSITFFFFQIVRGALTPVIFIYSIIGRVRVFFLILLTICFSIIVYAPLAYWHWNHNGWLIKLGAIDFSGGNVIHLAAGFAGLASYYYMGVPENRKEHQTVQSITLSLKGVGMLWFGWLGFTGGAALSASSLASQAVAATLLSCCAGGIAWAAMYYVLTDKPSLQGWCNGSICGLVAISSGCGYVPLWASLVIGVISGLISFFFCYYKSLYFGQINKLLDVFGCHGLNGLWGGIATGLFASTETGNIYNGLFYGDGKQFGLNLLSVIVTAAYSFVTTTIIYFILIRLFEPKVSQQEQKVGSDFKIHGEGKNPLTRQQIISLMKSMRQIENENPLELRASQKSIKTDEIADTQYELMEVKLNANRKEHMNQSFQQKI